MDYAKRDRQMYDNGGQGWVCSDCGGKIDKLPFEPKDTSNLRCFDCHKKSGPAPRRNDRGDRGGRPERQMFDNGGQGWSCSSCGGKIDKLPFEPRSTDGLKCRDCFRN